MNPDPFPASDFDEWAETYDQSTLETSSFPFTGYEAVLRSILKIADPRPGMKVLDLGTGTGNLAQPFQTAGCEVWGTDFSEAMLAKAGAKIPGAQLFLHDLRQPLPPELVQPFERIVSAYVFHHFPLDQKVSILKELCDRSLADGGMLIIGDIAFPDEAARDQIRADLGEAWEEEYYWQANESLPALERAGILAQYHQVSNCAGVFVLLPAAGGSGESAPTDRLG